MDYFSFSSPVQREIFWVIFIGTGVMVLLAFTFLAFLLNSSRERSRNQIKWKQRDAEERERMEKALEENAEQTLQKVSALLHDHLGSQSGNLSSLIAQMESDIQEGTLPDKAKAKLAAKYAKATYEDIRCLSHMIDNTLLLENGLLGSIKDLLDDMHISNDYCVRLDVAEGFETGLTPWEELQVYRIFEEYLHNVHKYAQARSIQIAFRPIPEGLELQIFDDGSSFDAHKLKRPGLGWSNILHRMDKLQAHVTIDNGKVGCTQLTLHIPHRNPSIKNKNL